MANNSLIKTIIHSVMLRCNLLHIQWSKHVWGLARQRDEGWVGWPGEPPASTFAFYHSSTSYVYLMCIMTPLPAAWVLLFAAPSQQDCNNILRDTTAHEADQHWISTSEYSWSAPHVVASLHSLLQSRCQLQSGYEVRPCWKVSKRPATQPLICETSASQHQKCLSCLRKHPLLIKQKPTMTSVVRCQLKSKDNIW